MSHVMDDKSEHCIPFLLERLHIHRERNGNKTPFFLGLNGVQGAGKTTLVSALSRTLSSPPYSLRPAVLSLDDFYLTHSDQISLALSRPTNPLVQHRGQPSTHDLPLLISTLKALHERTRTKLPVFDKSLHDGQGDRTDAGTWEEVNKIPNATIDVVILEGWCVGFCALSEENLVKEHKLARLKRINEDGNSQLGKLKLENVEFINDALREYQNVWSMFDAFIHIDAADTMWVYNWRLEAEHKMREEKGKGMTDEQVKKFVDGYYPAYELYTSTLRNGIFADKGRQLRLTVGEDRKVEEVQLI